MATSSTPKARSKCAQISRDLKGIELQNPLLKQLDIQRNKDILTDVVLKCKGEDFSCHKNILAAASPYFRAMFTSGMTECESNIVTFSTIDGKTMKILLDCIYCGHMAIPLGSVQELCRVLEASHMLQMDSLFHHCCEMLVTKLTKDNFIVILEIADKYNEDMKNSVIKYIARDFLSSSRSEEFQMLHFTEILAVLKSPEIDVHSVLSVMEAVIRWAKQDLQQREEYLEDLLSCVKIQSLSKEHLQQLLEKATVWESPAFMKMLLKCISQRYFESGRNEITERKPIASKHQSRNVNKRGY